MDRHATGPRTVAGPGARGFGPAVAAAGRRDGTPAALRAERGARRRGDAPGRQAEQCAARPGRPGRADRLRYRHLPGRSQAHPDRHGDGLARVHRSRADPRRRRVAGFRPVVTGRDPLRGGGGARPLREARRSDHHHVRHHQRGRTRSAHGGCARSGDRRAAAPGARGPAGRERGRADDHRRAAAADRPDAELGWLRAHRPVGVIPSGVAPARISSARISPARINSARFISAGINSARIISAGVSSARIISATAACAGRDLAGLRLGGADEAEGPAGPGGRHGAAGRRPGVGRANRPDRAAAGPDPAPPTSPDPGPPTSPSPSLSPAMARRRGQAARPSRRPDRRPGPTPGRGTRRAGGGGRACGGRSPRRCWR